MTEFTEQELSKINKMFSEYLEFVEAKITDGLEQQKVIEKLLEALREAGTDEDQEAIAMYEDSCDSFNETINTFLDERPIITSILEKCKEMKSK
jgi:hypothetical protein